MAFVFGFLGLLVYYNPFLVFIALFVWMGASAEASMAQMRSALEGIPVSRAMVTDLRRISPTDRLDDVAAHVISGFQQDFPVMQDRRLVGMLTRADLLRALAELGRSAYVESVMRREFEKAEPSEMLESAFARLRECDCHSLPVVFGGDLVGLVTMENVGEFLMIQSALRRVPSV
jgi:CBS domain-containing protein